MSEKDNKVEAKASGEVTKSKVENTEAEQNHKEYEITGNDLFGFKSDTPKDATKVESAAEGDEVEKEVEAVDPEPKDDGPDPMQELQKQLETERQRRADTQASWQKTYEETRKAVNELVEAGAISQEDADKRLEGIKGANPEPTALDDIVKRFQQEFPIAKSVSSEGDETLDKYARAFDTLALYDPQIVNELMGMSPQETTSYILKTGKDLVEVLDKVEASGSVLKALKDGSGPSEADLKDAEEKGYERGLKEAEEKYKDYVSSSRPKKPSLKGTAEVPKDKSSTSDLTARDIGLF